MRSSRVGEELGGLTDSGAAVSSASRGPTENCVLWGGGGGWNSEGGCFVFHDDPFAT